MTHWIEVIILGIIEGITEFLPISSTGHLLIAQNWFNPRSDLFNFVVQSGAVLAVITVFWRRILELFRTLKSRDTQSYLGKLALAFFIGAAGGLVLKKLDWELPENVKPVALALLIGGVVIIFVERWLRTRKLSDEITWIVAVAVGFAQLIALVFPGTSRSGATILMALILGANRVKATEFSFLLGVPSLLAAGGYETMSYFMSDNPPEEDWNLVLVGTLVSAVTAFIAVKWLLRFLQSHTFVGFGWYRIGLGVLLLLLL